MTTSTREWLRPEVDRMVTAYKAGDWAAVHAAIDRMIALDQGGIVVLTREEAEHAADWHDYIVDQGGEVPPEETELALRLRSGAAS